MKSFYHNKIIVIPTEKGKRNINLRIFDISLSIINKINESEDQTISDKDYIKIESEEIPELKNVKSKFTENSRIFKTCKRANYLDTLEDLRNFLTLKINSYSEGDQLNDGKDSRTVDTTEFGSQSTVGNSEKSKKKLP